MSKYMKIFDLINKCDNLKDKSVLIRLIYRVKDIELIYISRIINNRPDIFVDIQDKPVIYKFYLRLVKKVKLNVDFFFLEYITPEIYSRLLHDLFIELDSTRMEHDETRFIINNIIYIFNLLRRMNKLSELDLDVILNNGNDVSMDILLLVLFLNNKDGLLRDIYNDLLKNKIDDYVDYATKCVVKKAIK